ncbi:MAG: prkC 15 [Planctomycetaceae bacterium]|nr:prkC 15 [Planctomycetaceae bacterium]
MTTPQSTKPGSNELEATIVTDVASAKQGGDALEATFVPEKTVTSLDATLIGAEPLAGAPIPVATSTPKTAAPRSAATPPKPASVTAPGAVSDKSGAVKPPEKKATQLGDFKLVKKLGQGGMGEVFLAHQISLDRQVALKVMNKQFSKQENFVKRFKREAQTMAKLNHPNIVQGYAVGEESGLLYLAMELVKGHEKGRSLQDWMDNLKKLEVGDALHVILVIADALKYANEMSLIHRDIKPDNMLITEKGVVKLSDMGLAKATDEDMSMTQSGTGLGTPYYMPPEQAADAKHVDHRSDIYALGCTLYYFTTGELPFKGTSAMELIMAKTKGTFARARSLSKDIPERLDLIMDKMIAKDPKSRYQTYDELIRDLQSLGKANPTLSFIGVVSGSAATPSVTVMAGSTMVSGMGTTSGNAARPGAGQSGANRAPVAAAAAAQSQAEATWFVIQPQPNGPPKKSKFTTSQILQLLKTGALDVSVKCCLTSSTDYRPIASFSQFENVVKAKNVQAKAEKKTENFKQLYNEIDRAQRWRPWVKWFQGFFDGVKGLISLVLYLAVLIGIGVGLWMYWPTIMGMIQTRTGTGTPAVTAPGTAPKP